MQGGGFSPVQRSPEARIESVVEVSRGKSAGGGQNAGLSTEGKTRSLSSSSATKIAFHRGQSVTIFGESGRDSRGPFPLGRPALSCRLGQWKGPGSSQEQRPHLLQFETLRRSDLLHFLVLRASKQELRLLLRTPRPKQRALSPAESWLVRDAAPSVSVAGGSPGRRISACGILLNSLLLVSPGKGRSRAETQALQ